MIEGDSMNQILCERRTYPDITDTHTHSYAQLMLPLRGKLYIETDYKKLTLDEDNLFFIPPVCEHTYTANSSNEFLVLDIPEHLVSSKDMARLPGGSALPLSEKWKAIRFLLLEEMRNQGNPSAIGILFHYFYNDIMKACMPKSVRYMQEHFNESIDLKHLAAMEHYQVSYYCEWFKNTMKMTPMEYLKRMRVDKAKELIVHSGLTILQIAHEVGYRHHASLTRAFRELEGMSPVDFRTRNIK